MARLFYELSIKVFIITESLNSRNKQRETYFTQKFYLLLFKDNVRRHRSVASGGRYTSLRATSVVQRRACR